MFTEQEIETLQYAAQAAGSQNANMRAMAGGILRLYEGFKALEARHESEVGALKAEVAQLKSALGEDAPPAEVE